MILGFRLGYRRSNYIHIYIYKWVFPKIVVPQNGWFTRETPIKMDDLGGNTPIFGSTPKWIRRVLGV